MIALACDAASQRTSHSAGPVPAADARIDVLVWFGPGIQDVAKAVMGEGGGGTRVEVVGPMREEERFPEESHKSRR